MFEGIYFEFPKLSFLLFVFLACDNLCPLRPSALYFPHLVHFQTIGIKPPAWMWISKWVMISSLIVALMSPVKEEEKIPRFEGYSTLLVVDTMNPKRLKQIEQWCDLRRHDHIALYLPPAFKIPLTSDHNTLLKMVRQIPENTKVIPVDYTLKTFFSLQQRGWIVIFSDAPKTFVHSLPTDIERSIIPQERWEEWMKKESDAHRPLPIAEGHPVVKHLYFYPLFLGLLAMILYLYGRNQKGVI